MADAPSVIALTEVTAEDIMWKSISTMGFVAAVSVVSLGCERRREITPVSHAEITSVEVIGVSPDVRTISSFERGEYDLTMYRESALGDLANLDERLHRLEQRAGSRAASSDTRTTLDEARRRRDALAQRIEGLQVGAWEREREDVQRQWEEVSAMTERAGDLLADRAR